MKTANRKKTGSRRQMSESFVTAAFLSVSGGLQDAYTYFCRGRPSARFQATPSPPPCASATCEAG